jgi:predicted amidophosphoribosyltransferase
MLLAALADLVLPVSCLGCGAGGSVICAACADQGAPRWVSQHPPTVSAGEYDGLLRAALLGYKERGRRDLTRPLASYLADSIGQFLGDGIAPALVPVPSSRRAVRSRGGAHLLPLARFAARRNRLRVVQPLTLTRSVRDSAGLSGIDREANLAEAMTAARPVERRQTALIVDDIVTTGVTLREAERALIAAGWSVLGAATIAATPRRRAVQIPSE